MKRKSLDLATKVEICNAIDNKMSSKDIFAKFGIDKIQLYNIKKIKDKILSLKEKSWNFPSHLTKLRKSKYSEIEQILFEWFLLQRKQKINVNDILLEVKARELIKVYNLNHVVVNRSFITRFKTRYGISLKAISGEAFTVDEDIVKEWQENFMTEFNNAGWLPEQIYNADESALVYKNLDSRTLIAPFEQRASGFINSKEKITIMPCVNATGTHKLNLMVIGKSKNPRAFKDWQNPLWYRSSKNAWQTSILFKEWFHEAFVPSVKLFLTEKNLPGKALLILDNATCHKSVEELQSECGNFKATYLPPKTTSVLQPLDQNIIRSIKIRYRKNLLLHLASDESEQPRDKLKNLNLKTVIYMLNKAWCDIPSSLIRKSWRCILPYETYNDSKLIENAEDNNLILISKIYNKIIPENDLTSQQIVEWAEGFSEIKKSFNNEQEELLDEAVESIKSVNSSKNEQVDNVIRCLNYTISWAQDNNLDISEINCLIEVRNKVTESKFQ